MNEVLGCVIIAGIIAQALKVPIFYFRNRTWDWSLLLSTGKMPSSHTAIVTSLVFAVGYVNGMSSTEFAIAFVLAGIVIHDAVKVRGAAGEQARVVNHMIKDMVDIQEALGKTNFELAEEKLKEALGHTYSEVFAGFLLGMIIPVIYFI